MCLYWSYTLLYCQSEREAERDTHRVFFWEREAKWILLGGMYATWCVCIDLIHCYIVRVREKQRERNPHRVLLRDKEAKWILSGGMYATWCVCIDLIHCYIVRVREKHRETRIEVYWEREAKWILSGGMYATWCVCIDLIYWDDLQIYPLHYLDLDGQFNTYNPTYC